MDYKLLITNYENRIVSALYDEKRPVQILADPVEERTLRIGGIYIGRISNIVKNLNAAFVEICPGVMGYLALDGALFPIVKQTHADGKLHTGDEVIVQIEREEIKTKVAALTVNFNLTGKYLVLVHGKPIIGVSAKITNPQKRKGLKELLETQTDGESYGFIVRTNAQDASPDEILHEVEELKKRYQKITENGLYRTAFSVLEGPLPAYLCSLRDINAAMLGQILTDDKKLYAQIKDYLEEYQPVDAAKLMLYQDEFPMRKRYSLKERIEEALHTKVWLKSGASIIIEPTEALTVIDVNTGKAVKGGARGDEFFLKINLEAAAEIAYQIRLRNLSGIIMVDFIDLESEEANEKLLAGMRELLAKDPVKAVVVDMTMLHLVEITRKKVRRPLHEEFAVNSDRRNKPC